jgi:hypothetical protein
MSSSIVQWACTVVVWALIGLLDNGDGARRRSSKQGEEDIRLTGKKDEAKFICEMTTFKVVFASRGRQLHSRAHRRI